MSGPSRPALKSGSVNSVPPDSGAPCAVRPISVSCSRELVRSHGLDAHVDPAGDEVGAVGQPVGAGSSPSVHPDELVDVVGVLGLEVGGAVLEAHQVARRGLASTVEEVRPKPSWAHRTATVPKPMRARLRIACTATCGSWAQACTQRSPLLRAGSRLSAGKCGSSSSAAGPPVREAEPVVPSVEQDRPEPEGEGQPRRMQAERLAGVGRRGGTARAAARRPAARPSSRGQRRSSPAAARPARRASRW